VLSSVRLRDDGSVASSVGMTMPKETTETEDDSVRSIRWVWMRYASRCEGIEWIERARQSSA
jgi:hypothetical protein